MSEVGTLDEAADALYAGPRAEFVQRRGELSRAARATGDASLAREIAELRKPSVTAAALNALARADTSTVRRVLELAEQMRGAQRRADGDELRRLVRARQDLVPEVVDLVRQVAADRGEPLSGSSLTEAEHALRRAIVDPRFADELRAGRVASIPAGGADLVLDVDPAPVRARGSARVDAPPSRRREDEARRRHAAAVEELAATATRLAAAHDAARALEAQHAELQQRIDTMRAALHTQESAAHELATRVRAAHTELRRAEADARRVQQDEERLRARASRNTHVS